MSNDEYNNDFFGYYGKIDRKNYVINMLIMITVGVLCKFINVEPLFKYSSLTFLKPVLEFAVSMLIFVVFFACLSLIYRRLADITSKSSEKVKNIVRNLFMFLFVLPSLYLLCIRYFIYDIPFIPRIFDLFTFVILPFSLICTFVIAFFKDGNNPKC